jgi:hypothetical protein
VTDPVDRDRQVEQLLRQSLPAARSASSGCIDAERLAAWSAGSLLRDDAAMVERHLADCVECQAMLAAFVESEPVPTAAAAPFWQRWSLRWLVPVAAASVAVFVWTVSTREHADVSPEPSTTMARAEPAAPPPSLEPLPAAQSMAEGARLPSVPPAGVSSPEVAAVAATPAVADEAPSRQASSTAPAAVAQASREMAMERQAAVAPLESATAVPAPPAPGAVTAERPVSLRTEPAARLSAAPAAPVPAAAAASAAPADATGRRLLAAGREGSLLMDALAAGSTTPVHARAGTLAAPFSPSAQAAVRWRIQPDGRVERSMDRGQTWVPIDLGAATPITAGSAPAADVCWLVGRDGVVLRSTTGQSFERRPFPGSPALVAVEALDAARATVTTADGTIFTTSDGGATWIVRP